MISLHSPSNDSIVYRWELWGCYFSKATRVSGDNNTNYLGGQMTEYAGATEKRRRQPLFRVKNSKTAATEKSTERVPPKYSSHTATTPAHLRTCSKKLMTPLVRWGNEGPGVFNNWLSCVHRLMSSGVWTSPGGAGDGWGHRMCFPCVLHAHCQGKV